MIAIGLRSDALAKETEVLVVGRSRVDGIVVLIDVHAAAREIEIPVVVDVDSERQCVCGKVVEHDVAAITRTADPDLADADRTDRREMAQRGQDGPLLHVKASQRQGQGICDPRLHPHQSRSCFEHPVVETVDARRK